MIVGREAEGELPIPTSILPLLFRVRTLNTLWVAMCQAKRLSVSRVICSMIWQ